MRKRIKAVSDSGSDNYSSDDEDYVPVDSGVSLKELNKNLKEFNKNFNKNTFWSNLIWYIKWSMIIFSQMVIAIYCCDYLYSIINPESINFFTSSTTFNYDSSEVSEPNCFKIVGAI